MSNKPTVTRFTWSTDDINLDNSATKEHYKLTYDGVVQIFSTVGGYRYKKITSKKGLKYVADMLAVAFETNPYHVEA